MRFYYISLISIVLLFVIWIVGTGLLVWLGSHLRKTRKRIWPVMLPLFLLLYLAPIAEELWIAWNFGQLCKKDAGIFIYQTVEVDGFYDATRPTHAGPRTPQAIESYEKGGYKFYELVYRNRKGGPNKVVHIEKQDGVWTPTVIDQPTARYHYRWPHMSSSVAHKIVKGERVVVDSQTDQVLGRHLNYARKAPWFFVHLDRSNMGCIEVKEDERERGSVFGPRMVLFPKS